MENIFGTICVVLYFIYMIYRAVSQSKNEAQKPPVIDDELEVIIKSKKPPAVTGQGIVKVRQKKALRRTLPPIQGEGSRFETVSEPSTAAEVVALAVPAATLIETQPHLGSLTGDYGLPVSESKGAVPPVNFFHFLDSHESVRHAVVLSEILGKPKGMES